MGGTVRGPPHPFGTCRCWAFWVLLLLLGDAVFGDYSAVKVTTAV